MHVMYMSCTCHVHVERVRNSSWALLGCVLLFLTSVFDDLFHIRCDNHYLLLILALASLHVHCYALHFAVVYLCDLIQFATL